MSETIDSIVPFRVGPWLPSDHKILTEWLGKVVVKVEGTDSVDAEEDVDGDLIPRLGSLHPVIEEFKELIETDPKINMYFHQMFFQVPLKPPYNKDPSGQPQIRNYQMMLRVMNHIMTEAPEYNNTGVVGCPLNAILDWPMGTIGSGFDENLNSKVNVQLNKILNNWGTFLKSPESAYVLSNDPEHGWFGSEAMKKMPHFVEEFQCDPKEEHYGFTSWDDFFTRKFRKGIRPVAFPDDDSVIVNACESAPYRIALNVKRQDKFWIKSQCYSMESMLGNDPLTDEFVGGTVYQAFLSAFNYHRWHSPVSGTIKKTVVIDGSYTAEASSENPDDAGPNKSQGYLTPVASRSLIFIQADNPAIGLMCFTAIGTEEISSCEITVFEGQHVTKGQEIGMFHYRGSTHSLVFRSGVKVNFDLHDQTPGLHASNIHVKAKIADVSS